MADRTNSRVALMAIHPGYANAILDGIKKVEFRKRPLADDVTRVLIYSTSPVQQVVGEFGIERTVVDHPNTLWDDFGDIGSIDQDSFDRYFASRETGVAFVISWTKKYASPQRLNELASSPSIPQSFSYVEG